jgi:hypothetical protein
LLIDSGFSPPPLPETNSSEKFGSEYRDVYSARTKLLVENKFEKDIDTFNFHF